ncbi:MAG TPA: hypothetical protein DCX06_13665 [Opitutae bacterium]|nr:hypothetical protein [Opitutae bacterium]
MRKPNYQRSFLALRVRISQAALSNRYALRRPLYQFQEIEVLKSKSVHNHYREVSEPKPCRMQ